MPEPTSTSRLPLLAPQTPRPSKKRSPDKQRADDVGHDRGRETGGSPSTATLSPETERALHGSPAPLPTDQPPPSRRSRRRDRKDRGTLFWTMAKCLILGAFIALAFAIWLAATPVQNPGVQDCGSPMGFIVFTRTDVKVLPPNAPNPGELILQPTCRERVDSQMLRAIVAFGAFLGLGLLGAIIGLLDDRWEYHKAPRFESLLRERPKNAPGRLRAPPVVEEEELGVALPQVEGPDLVILLFFTAVTIGGLMAFAGVADVLDAIGTVGTIGLIGVGLLAAATFVIAGLQMVLAEPDPATAAASGEDEEGVRLPRAVELSLAAAAAERLLPGLGPLGLDAHALSVAGEPKHLTLRRLDARQALGVGVHVVLIILAFLAASTSTLPTITWPSTWWALAVPVGLLCLIGLVRAPGRMRRLVIPPSPRAVKEAVDASPQRAAGLLGSALAMTLVNLALFVLSLSLVATIESGLPSTATLARLALVYLLACVVGSLSPTPGGMGAMEPFAVLGLLVCGVLPSTAVAGVLLFRLATLWLPFLIGLVPFVRLKRRHII